MAKIVFTNPPTQPLIKQPKDTGPTSIPESFSPFSFTKPANPFANNNIKFKYDLNIADLASSLGINAEHLWKFWQNPVKTQFMKDTQDLIGGPGTTGLGNNTIGSFFGLPVFGRLSLSISNPNLSLNIYLDNCWVTITQKKNILKTPVNGYRGMIHEVLSIFDYDIKIEGLYAGEQPENYGPANSADQDMLQDLITIANWSSDVKIQHIITDKCNIQNILIDEIEFNQSKDYSNIIYFKITACDSSSLPIAY